MEEAHMLLKQSVLKTRMFFHKTLHNMKSFFFSGYQKLPKPHPFYCGSIRMKDNKAADQFYPEFDKWECKLEKTDTSTTQENVVTPKVHTKEEEDPARNRKETQRKVETKKMGNGNGVTSADLCPESGSHGGVVLAQKMKELEMMDVGDMDHVLDIEEAMHYYSRLKSPVYLDIVDKFFMDMYSDFSGPQASSTKKIGYSKRRHRSVRSIRY